MNDVKPSKEEKKLLNAVEAGEFESVLTKKRRGELVTAATKIQPVKTKELISEFLIVT